MPTSPSFHVCVRRVYLPLVRIFYRRSTVFRVTESSRKCGEEGEREEREEYRRVTNGERRKKGKVRREREKRERDPLTCLLVHTSANPVCQFNVARTPRRTFFLKSAHCVVLTS